MSVFIYGGAFTGRATPVPIPNTAVKPSWADGTAVARLWESRSVPPYFFELTRQLFVFNE